MYFSAPWKSTFAIFVVTCGSAPLLAENEIDENCSVTKLYVPLPIRFTRKFESSADPSTVASKLLASGRAGVSPSEYFTATVTCTQSSAFGLLPPPSKLASKIGSLAGQSCNPSVHQRYLIIMPIGTRTPMSL